MLELRQHVSYLELAGADAALCVALQKCLFSNLTEKNCSFMNRKNE